jgi:hypothetical protein
VNLIVLLIILFILFGGGGYYVGGGCAHPCKADLRCCNEGTWGWDYAGIFVKKRVNLDWTHGRRYQGGTGQYRSAGPSPVKTITAPANASKAPKIFSPGEMIMGSPSRGPVN